MFTPTNKHEQRIRITENDSHKLPAQTRAVRVYAGGAWLSHRGMNYRLREGEIMVLPRAAQGAVVTAQGRYPLVLELFS